MSILVAVERSNEVEEVVRFELGPRRMSNKSQNTSAVYPPND